MTTTYSGRTKLPRHLAPPARRDTHTEPECDEVLARLAVLMRQGRREGEHEVPTMRWEAWVHSADEWLDERNRCTSALALHAALAAKDGQ